MDKKQLLAMLDKILPEKVEFSLRKAVKSDGSYAIAKVDAQTRHEFQIGSETGEGTPKVTFIFGQATPKGVKPVVTGPKNAVSLESWKAKYAK